MPTEPHQQLQKALGALADLPPGELARTEQIFRPARLERGEYFVEAGRVPGQIGFVVSGLLRSYFLTQAGAEYTMSFFMERQFVASYSALLTGQESRLYVQALEPTAMLVVNWRDYQALLDSHADWQVVGRKLAEASFLRKEQREIALLADSAETRYLAFLKEFAGLEKRVRQHYIASYLGINPVSLSRLRARLSR